MSIQGDLKAHDLSFAEIERLAYRGRIERSKAFRGFFGMPSEGKEAKETGGFAAAHAVPARG